MPGQITASKAYRTVPAFRPKAVPEFAIVDLPEPLRVHGDETLRALASEIGCAIGADCLQVSWHRDASSVFLTTYGSPDDEAIEEMQRCAACVTASSAKPNTWFVAGGRAGKILTAPIPTDGGVITVTALFREGCPSSRNAAGHVLPLVQPFVRLWSQRHQSSQRLRGLTAAVDQSGVGIALVGRDGQLIFANRAAEALMAEADGLRRRGQMMCGTKLTETLRLQAAIEYIASTQAMPGIGRSPLSPVVALSRKTRRPLMAAVVAGDGGADGEEGSVIVYLFDPEQDLRALLEPVCKLYGLSPVETKLTCLLADGISLAEAAGKMRVREQTARSYLKQVFLKTDTNRQAELVWLMLKSSVRTAPGCLASLV